ncbi:hypothetical protein N2600_26285 (plasmid) [Rhizobium sp. WSM1274]|uniref:hypothetical protein n=1 Tax=Rhizobium sp. WSM1274 TaxID=3138254 RepID=UPI0021A57CE3|nr:hypothetical protein [Rhizobium leguminosarum]UWU31700.1 hypothetical protein N2600_26285 [Rhizobium leguminosarum bv. viciae]
MKADQACVSGELLYHSMMQLKQGEQLCRTQRLGPPTFQDALDLVDRREFCPSRERVELIQDGGGQRSPPFDTVPNAAETYAHRMVDMKDIASPNAP